jgi:hypothetical protein
MSCCDQCNSAILSLKVIYFESKRIFFFRKIYEGAIRAWQLYSSLWERCTVLLPGTFEIFPNITICVTSPPHTLRAKLYFKF